MKTITKITAAALVASVLGATLAQAATSATGSVNATVVSQLSIVQTASLNFGSFSPSATAGTINHFGQTTGGVTSLGGTQFGVFTVTGTPTTNFNITTTPTTVVLSNGVNTMSAAISAPTLSATNSVGTGIVNVTGTLSVAANQAGGAYSGSYNVSVNY